MITTNDDAPHMVVISIDARIYEKCSKTGECKLPKGGTKRRVIGIQGINRQDCEEQLIKFLEELGGNVIQSVNERA